MCIRDRFDIRAQTQDIQSKKAQASFQLEGAKLKNMAAKGQVANMGQQGRTARKNMHAAIAAYGQQQTAMVDAITRSEDAYALGMEKTYKSTALSQRQLRESMKSAGSQYEADQTQTALNKYSADLAAEARIAPEPQMKPQLSRPLTLPKPQNLAPEEPPSWEQYESIKPIKGAYSKQSGFSKMMGVVSTVASIASLFPSDDRLKYDITRVGTSKSGIPKYTFRYRQDGKHGPKYIGTSAQDLITMGREDAVVQKENDGFYTVDYSKLDVKMEVVST